MNVITANCSFVTSYPRLVAGSNEPFAFPASENITLFTLLDGEVTHEKLFGLFKKSITNINEKMNETQNDYYCAAGLQELNNTEEVFTEVNKIINDGKLFICSNVFDGYGGTYPALGYIVKGTKDEFMKKSVKNKNKIDIVKENKLVKIPDGKENLCYSILNDVKDNIPTNSDLISIRDLGSIEEIVNIKLLKNINNKGEEIPDSGRPISMIIKKK